MLGRKVWVVSGHVRNVFTTGLLNSEPGWNRQVAPLEDSYGLRARDLQILPDLERPNLPLDAPVADGLACNAKQFAQLLGGYKPFVIETSHDSAPRVQFEQADAI